MLQSERLALRALEKPDLIFMHQLHNSFRNMSYFFEEPYETLRELEELFEKHLHNPSERRFIVEDRASRNNIGLISLVEINEINRNAAIDIIIDDQYQGKGNGKEGFALVVKYGFDILNLHKLYLEVLPQNEIGKKIYSSFGFKEECVLKQEYFVDGEYVDSCRMCLFAFEWQDMRSQIQKKFGIENPFSVKKSTRK